MPEPIALAFRVKALLPRAADPQAELADDDFAGRRLDAIERDGWRCRACGCPSQPVPHHPSGGFEVHHLDNNHRNNDPANLATLCPLCHGIFHIGWTVRHRKGRLVWLPEVPQAQLDMLVHMAAIARHRTRDAGGDDAGGALRLARNLAALHGRIARLGIPDALLADTATGEGHGHLLANDPSLLGALVARLQRERGFDAGALDAVLGGLRYCYALEADENAPVYSACLAWIPSGDWPQAWIAEGRRCRAATAGR